MRTTLADFRETQSDKDGDDLIWFEDGDASHRLCNGNVLDTDKLRL